MDAGIRELQERLAFMQRHIEQQDRVVLELSREVAEISKRLARAEAKAQQAGDSEAGPPADERPPHW
jgi:uncharacterized coiled-coil protein SlyX